MANSTASRAAGFTRSDPFTTRDTVARETPACSATNSRVGLGFRASCMLMIYAQVSCSNPPVEHDDGPRHQKQPRTIKVQVLCHCTISRNQPCVGPATILNSPHLALVVDVDDAKAFGVSPSPLEVIQQ